MDHQQILVIDHQNNAAEHLVSLLQAEGYRAVSVPDGETGLAKIQHNVIDLVIVDHEHLPDRDIGILRDLKEFDSALSIVVLSEDDSFASVREALRNKVADYLKKPADDHKLLTAVNYALSQRASQLQKRQYLEQVKYLLARIEGMERTDVKHAEMDELHEGRYFAINRTTLVDVEQQAVLYKDQTIPLSQGDLGLLFVFLNNPRQILSFQDIILQKENVKLPEDRARTRVRAMIHRLRSRLADIPGGDQWIESVRGRGYIFNV